jgi:hypothetical protein
MRELDMLNKFNKAFHNQKDRAKKRGIEFLFTFKEWKQWWIDTGKWEMRGKFKGCYQMCRNNDSGPYASWNVYCATISDNRREYSLGRPLPEKVKAKVSATMSGRKLSKEHIQKLTGANNGHAKITVTPLGKFRTANDAAFAHNCSASFISKLCKQKPTQFYHI